VSCLVGRLGAMRLNAHLSAITCSPREAMLVGTSGTVLTVKQSIAS